MWVDPSMKEEANKLSAVSDDIALNLEESHKPVAVARPADHFKIVSITSC
jgi:hypothetical protein